MLFRSVGISVLLSGIVSLTITPTMCALMLKHDHAHGAIFNLSEKAFDWLRNGYVTTLRWILKIYPLVLIGSVVVLVATGYLYQIVQKGFIPRQDTGVINANVRAREGIPFNEMIRYQQQVSEIIQKNPNVEAVMSTAGQGVGGVVGENVGRFIIRLKDRDKRANTADEVVQQIRRDAARIQGVRLFLSNPPAIRIGGTLSTSDYLFVMTGTNLKSLYKPGEEMEARLRSMTNMVQDVSSNLELQIGRAHV